MRYFHEHRHCNCHHRLNEKQVISTVNTTRVDDEGMKRCPICGNEDIEERELCFGDGIYDLSQTMYCPECDKEWTSWWRLKYDTSNVKNRYKHGNKKWTYRKLDDVGFVPGHCPYCGSMDAEVEGVSSDHIRNVVVTNECLNCRGLWDDIWEITEYIDTRIDDPEADQKRYDLENYYRMVNKYYGHKRLKPDEKAEVEEIDRLHKIYGGGLEIPGHC